MPSFAYTAAQWGEYVSGALAVAALALTAWYLARYRPLRALRALAAAVAAGALFFGSFKVLQGRVEEIRLGSISRLGLEMHHAGLRSNAEIYSIPAAVTVSWRPIEILGPITAFLVHKTTTLHAEVAVYGLVDFTAVASRMATVNRQAHTITLTLPEPAIDRNTTYIWAVNGVQEQTGLLNAVAQSLFGPFEALFHHSSLSFDAEPALSSAEAAALARARHSAALASCGKQEIAQQLAAILNLTPAYRGYTVVVRWPVPPARGADCSVLQRQLRRVSTPGVSTPAGTPAPATSG
jgi:hypothetical protein